MQNRLFHDIILPEEPMKIRREVREFVGKEIEPVAYEIDEGEETKNSFPMDIFNKMANQGLFKIPFPKRMGEEASITLS